MQVVRASGVGYYVRDLVPGRAEGSLVAGESPGAWTGGGSAVLGLRGRVGPDEFTEVFAGRDPLGDRALRDGRGARAVAGVDLTFCAPKSVSVLHLLAPRELGAATGAAHEAAVADALGYLERTALGVRRTRGGVTRRVAATGAVAAGFVHRTSRALDPHLHTHLVAANVAQGADGLWSSIDSRRLFLHRRDVQAVYDSSLRHELTRRAGVAWELGPSGRWDVRGVDPTLVRLFSQRAASIDEHVFRAGSGRTSPGRRRAAFHADRPGKDATRTVEGLHADWRRRAADHGLHPADLVEVVGRTASVPDGTVVDRDALAGRVERVAGSRQAISSSDLVTAVAESSPAGLPAAGVERVAAALGGALAWDGDGRPAGSERDGPGPGPGGARWPVTDVVRALRAGGDAVDRALDGADPGPSPGGHAWSRELGTPRSRSVRPLAVSPDTGRTRASVERLR
jgi:conjugative relaxase-like TrwC/TraI family protein